MTVALPPLTGPLGDVWPLLFKLAVERPNGWILVGSQMAILHAAAHGVERPLATEDADVVIDIRELATSDVAKWLQDNAFELGPVSPDGIGHRFKRGGVTIDLLAIDHATMSDRTTVPPARTISVPGSRRALARATTTNVTTAEGHTGHVFVPDWLGALLLKARAAVAVPGQRPSICRTSPCCSGSPRTSSTGLASLPDATGNTSEPPPICSTTPTGVRSPEPSTFVPARQHSRS